MATSPDDPGPTDDLEPEYDFHSLRGVVRGKYAARSQEKKSMTYQVHLEESDEGFAASVPSLPGCHSQGTTEQEAIENITDAIREYLTAIRDRAVRPRQG